MKSIFASVTFLTLIFLGVELSHGVEEYGEFKGWGNAVDPDGDCKFTVQKGRLSIGIPGVDHALGFERGQMNAPRVLRAVEGDFIAEVKVSGPFPAGAASLVTARRPFHGAGLLIWQDEKNYIRLERAEMVFEGRNLSYASFEARSNGEFVRKGDGSELPLSEGATNLRVERRGGNVYASISTDGIQWSSLQPIAVELPNTVFIGVAAGHNTSSPFEPVFEDFKVFTEQMK
jgi:regulation of enolase protein 1 (concanavalin A-like superfamily)